MSDDKDEERNYRVWDNRSLEECSIDIAHSIFVYRQRIRVAIFPKFPHLNTEQVFILQDRLHLQKFRMEISG